MLRLVLKKSGFGLVEGIAAMAILITGIISVVSLSLSNLSASQGVVSRLIATNLAREGVEAVRSIRDGNWLKGNTKDTDPTASDSQAWDAGLNGVGDTTAIAVLDAKTLSWTMKFSPNNITDASAKLRRDEAISGLYRQSLENPIPLDEKNTSFSRLITIYSICRTSDGTKTSDQAQCGVGLIKIGIKVSSNVQWSEKGKTVNVSVQELLYNWRYSVSPYVP